MLPADVLLAKEVTTLCSPAPQELDTSTISFGCLAILAGRRAGTPPSTFL
jgi:hypothetical protein